MKKLTIVPFFNSQEGGVARMILSTPPEG